MGLLSKFRATPPQNTYEPMPMPMQSAPAPRIFGPDARERRTMVFPPEADPARTHMRICAKVMTVWGEDWQVEATRRLPDGRLLVSAVQGIPHPHPGRRQAPLSAQARQGIRPTDGERLAAGTRNHFAAELVEFDAIFGGVWIGNLDERQVRVRATVAAHLGCRPWEVDVVTTATFDEDGAARLDAVHVTRYPAMATAQKRQSAFRELLSVFPGAGDWWEIQDHPEHNYIVLKHRKKPELPQLAPLNRQLPQQMCPADWSTIPLGIDQYGKEVSINLKLTPHGLVVGETGSGKTIALVDWAAQALVRGHDLAIIDVVKGGVDFAELRDWVVEWAEDLTSAQLAIQKIYAEGQRRKGLLKQHRAVKWSDLSPEVRATEGVRPMTLIIDEYGSTVIEEKVDKALANTELGAEAMERNVAKAIIKTMVGKYARELRFVGIHLVVGIQRPDAKIVDGEVRSNLGAVVQLAAPGRPPGRDSLDMVFSPAQVKAVEETLYALDDGKSPGLGIIGAEGGGVTGMRVSYAPVERVAKMLRWVKVPEPEPLRVELPKAALRRLDEPADFSIIESTSGPQVIDVEADITFNLDDLVADGAEPSTPAVEEVPEVPSFSLEDLEAPEIEHDDVEPGMTFQIDEDEEDVPSEPISESMSRQIDHGLFDLLTDEDTSKE